MSESSSSAMDALGIGSDSLSLAHMHVSTALIVLGQQIAQITPRIQAAEQGAAAADRRATQSAQKLKLLQTAPEQLVAAAVALLARLDVLTTEQFARGEERAAREALRAVLLDLEAIEAE